MLQTLLSILSRLNSSSQTQRSKQSDSSASLARPSRASSDNQFLTKATEQIKKHEGLVLHGYKDHLGFLTLGYGRLIDQRRGGGITKAEAEYLLQNDIDTKLAELRNRIPWIDNLDDARKAVLLNMCFQLGIGGLMGFRNTLAKIEAGDYEGAADNMMKSKWAQQTPRRAKQMADQMRTGKWSGAK
jgi:lysozyme